MRLHLLWTSSCRNEFLALLYEPSCVGKSQVWLWSSCSWAGGTTSPTLALCPRIRSWGKMITRNIRGLSLIKEKDETYIIMVFQWINVYDKKEGAQMSLLSTQNRVDRKHFGSQNPERFPLDTRAIFSWLRELGPKTSSWKFFGSLYRDNEAEGSIWRGADWTQHHRLDVLPLTRSPSRQLSYSSPFPTISSWGHSLLSSALPLHCRTQWNLLRPIHFTPTPFFPGLETTHGEQSWGEKRGKDDSLGLLLRPFCFDPKARLDHICRLHLFPQDLIRKKTIWGWVHISRRSQEDHYQQ